MCQLEHRIENLGFNFTYDEYSFVLYIRKHPYTETCIRKVIYMKLQFSVGLKQELRQAM